MFTLSFAKAAFERAVKTFAQVLGALLVADPVAGLLDIDWGDAFSVAGLAAAVSLLTSIGSGAVTSDSRTSLTSAERLAE